MGLSPFRNCFTNSAARAPNPDPSRWRLLRAEQYQNAYVLVAKYEDCMNFEGVKVMVFRGAYQPRSRLDPHFSKDDATSPIARFRPDAAGLEMAIGLAKSFDKAREGT